MAGDYFRNAGSDARAAFQIYLRTGKIVPIATDSVEVKFNPWHDPEDGRFTFAGQGSYFGDGGANGSYQPIRRRTDGPSQSRSPLSNRSDAIRPGGGSGGGAGASGNWPSPTHRADRIVPGGGSFGGGGAGGSWDRPSASMQPGSRARAVATSRLPPTPAAKASIRPTPTNRAVQPKGKLSSEKPQKLRIERNGYHFEVNSDSGPGRRTEHVWGEWRLEKEGQRSRREQARAGGAARQASDDGGHFVAVRFNGPHDWFNHFAQDLKVNRGAYRVIEDGWARDIKAGNHVFVDIVPHYTGQSIRPDSLKITWTVEGQTYWRSIPNGRPEKTHGK